MYIYIYIYILYIYIYIYIISIRMYTLEVNNNCENLRPCHYIMTNIHLKKKICLVSRNV